MKKVLLTGASGFIARNCIQLLQNKNYDIHAVTSGTKGKPPGDKNVTWHQVDLLNELAVSELLRSVKPTHLLHFGWYTEHGKFWSGEENLAWTKSTIQLLKEFKKNGGRRIVGAGTCAEYDWRYGYCSENVTPLNSSSLYGRCKNAIRSIAQEYAALNDLSFAWGRIFFLYGPNENPKRLIAYVISTLLQNKPAHCSHGRQIRDFIHVADVADAFVTLLDSEVEGPVNIASGNPLPIRNITERIGEKLNRQELIQYDYGPGKPEDPPLLAADVQRLQNELHWNPRFNIDKGLENTINWWKNNLKAV